MERLLTGDPPFPRKSWRRVWGWYRAAVDHTLPPARITLKRIMVEREELYRSVPPPPPLGENILTSVPTSQTDNSVPTEEEVEWTVRRLWGYRLGGPSRMCAKHLW